MRIVYIILLLKIVASMPPPTMPPIQSCGDCMIEACDVNTTCEHGKTKDACGCCDVCIRMEGETCGGVESSEGSCDKGLTCKIRHPHSYKNIMLPEDSKVGKCEPGNISEWSHHPNGHVTFSQQTKIIVIS